MRQIREQLEGLVRDVTHKWATYPLNDIREFISRRKWLIGPREDHLVTDDEYKSLMSKTLKLPKMRVVCLRAFIQGWKRARE